MRARGRHAAGDRRRPSASRPHFPTRVQNAPVTGRRFLLLPGPTASAMSRRCATRLASTAIGPQLRTDRLSAEASCEGGRTGPTRLKPAPTYAFQQCGAMGREANRSGCFGIARSHPTAHKTRGGGPGGAAAEAEVFRSSRVGGATYGSALPRDSTRLDDLVAQLFRRRRHADVVRDQRTQLVAKLLRRGEVNRVERAKPGGT